MATSKILALIAAIAVSTTSVSAQIVKHDAGRTFEVITKCLEEMGMEKDIHFRKNPNSDMIQLNNAAVMSDFLANRSVTKADIDACWKSERKTKK